MFLTERRSGLDGESRRGENECKDFGVHCLVILCHFEQVVQKLVKQKGSKWFLGDNDSEGSNMGLLTIQRRLEDSLYSSPQEFAKDVKKVEPNSASSPCKYRLMWRYL